jgi:hypothetical protein
MNDDTNKPAAPNEGMPPGFQQAPMTGAEKKAWRKFMLVNYGMTTLGILLVPVAFLVRLGRWSMRTVWAHHVGNEFGDF